MSTAAERSGADSNESIFGGHAFPKEIAMCVGCVTRQEIAHPPTPRCFQLKDEICFCCFLSAINIDSTRLQIPPAMYVATKPTHFKSQTTGGRMRRWNDPHFPRVHRPLGVQLAEHLLAGDTTCTIALARTMASKYYHFCRLSRFFSRVYLLR